MNYGTKRMAIGILFVIAGAINYFFVEGRVLIPIGLILYGIFSFWNGSKYLHENKEIEP